MKIRRLKWLISFLIIIVLTIFILVTFVQKDDNDSKKVKVNQNKNTKEIKEMSLVMVGDVLTHDAVLKDALKKDGTYDFNSMFADVEPLIKNYDLKYVNQESIIGGPSFKISGYPTFNAPDAIGDNLVSMGFNMISLANNHAMDKGEKAILYSNNYWKNKNVITAGTYSSKEERDEIKIYEQNGIKYAFLSYTTSLNGSKLDQNKDYLVNIYSESKVASDIENIKDKVDVIMVAMHWGDEYSNTPNQKQREIAKYLSDLGVDLIIGSHPHVVQPIEYVGSTLVIYSLGNFISNQLVLGLNPAIGIMVGIDIKLEDDNVKMSIKQKELIYAYSDNSTNFKVIPFSKLNDKILPDYKNIESKYMNIVGDVI